jgi:perosamine synthetase
MGYMQVSELKSDAAPPRAAGAPPAYPRARLPVKPVLSGATFRRGRGHAMPCVLDAGPARFVTSGRVAISLALREAGIGPGDVVLVPAYHCASMIEPVICSGATPVFYRIHPDTTVNLDDIAAKLDGRVKMLMATNYFGFPQPLERLRSFCDAHAILLLEDCAHSFLGSYGGLPLGSYGDYAIASSMKFFPIYEGGCLVSARHTLDRVRLRSAGLAFEAKVAFNSVEEGLEYGRLPLLGAVVRLPLWLKDVLWRKIKARRQDGVPPLAPGSSDGGFDYDPAWMLTRTSRFARLIMRLVSRRRMGMMRRRNYLRIAQALHGMPGCRPLFPHLPDGVCPWVFPLLTEEPERVFHALKQAEVPVIRFGEYLWPGVDATVCGNSVELSRRVQQFPCHQELSERELTWMIGQIQRVLQAQQGNAL